MKQMKTIVLGFTLLALTLTACGSRTRTPEPTEVAAELPGDVETAAKQALSTETGVAVEEVEVVEAEPRDWPDACLGLAEEGEACAQVITPGWKVTLRADGETYVLHTNEDGTAIRMEE